MTCLGNKAKETIVQITRKLFWRNGRKSLQKNRTSEPSEKNFSWVAENANMEAIDIGKISDYSMFKLELHTGKGFREQIFAQNGWTKKKNMSKQKSLNRIWQPFSNELDLVIFK